MSNFYPENYHDGDSEHGGDVIWNELDWYQYLSRNKHEIRRVIACYKSVRYTHINYLEEVAKMMGWTSFVGCDLEESGSEEGFEDELDEEQYDGEVDMEPYTMHKNPLNLFSMGMYQHIQDQCEELLGRERDISAINIWRLATSLMEGQSNIVMVAYSLDIGDYALAVCHIKLALKAINESVRVVGKMPKTVSQVKEISLALFSLREMILKVSKDCREHNQSDLGDSE